MNHKSNMYEIRFSETEKMEEKHHYERKFKLMESFLVSGLFLLIEVNYGS